MDYQEKYKMLSQISDEGLLLIAKDVLDIYTQEQIDIAKEILKDRGIEVD